MESMRSATRWSLVFCRGVSSDISVVEVEDILRTRWYCMYVHERDIGLLEVL